MQEIYAEIDRYNQLASTSGRPIVRCVNLYRWCAFCDGWNIDGASNPYKAQILSDLDSAAAQEYAWPTNVTATNPPAAPTGLVASVGNATVNLSWNATPFATSYNVKRATINGGPYSIIASNIPGVSFVNTSFTPGTTYYYRVSAVNAIGESPNSNQASATPTNGLPDVLVTAISWTPLGTLFAPTNIVFKATVLNQGSASTPSGITLGVGFLVDGTQVSWAGGFSSPLAPSSSTVLTADGGPSGINYWPATPGPHIITANVDDIDRFPESNEGNNVADKQFSVFVRGYSVNSGGNTAGAFVADNYWTGSTNTFSAGNAIDTTAVVSPAPQNVYQTERWGNSTYTFNNLVPNTNYTIRLHFAEISPSVTTNGNRQFHVTINGTQVLTNFDILAGAGAKFKALVRQFTTYPNNNGQIIIQFVKGTSNEAKIGGLEAFATPALTQPRILLTSVTNGTAALVWSTYPGKTYRVQFKPDLAATNWNNLIPDVLAIGTNASKTDVSGTNQRFYRVMQVD
jgi:hypothetical protein